MPYNRMKRLFLRGLLWLYLLLEFGYMALSLEPGYLDFDNLPDTNFSCLGKVIGGYYADLETNCQMFHVCTIGQLDEPMDIRFLCLNGTVFDQETRVCERIDEVDCSKSEQFYGLNLELYGNTQPPILEDSPETEQPLIIKSTTATTSTTTSKPKATNAPFYTSAKPPTITTQGVAPHHFPVANSPDIRFNPEEINISLHPGAPPDIRTKPPVYQQQSYSDNNKKVVVTTHSENSDNKKVSVTTQSGVFDNGKVLQSGNFGERPQTQKPQHHSFGNSQANKNFHHSTPSDINYEFTFRQTEPNFADFHTELPDSFFHSDFHSDQDFAGHHHNPQSQQFKSSTFHDDFISTTKGVNHFQQKVPTTVRNFLQSLKPPAPNQPHHYNNQQTEKPQRVQLPLPLLPTLPSLTFSSPAPFALQHHIDTKRYTKDHPSPPRIVISASASVSDASGRRLNYSLGTIGAAEFLEQPPHSYDEYKDEDVGLDPFYHDVPKLEGSRTKREAIKHSDIIRSEEEAVNVLKFLFDWYKNNEKTATESTTVPTVITTTTTESSPTKAAEIELSAEASGASEIKESNNNFGKSELFKKNSKFNIISNVNGDKNIQERRSTDAVTKPPSKATTKKTATATRISSYEKDFLDELFGHEEDYVNDNFEPIAYNQKYGENEKKQDEPTEVPVEVIKSNPIPKDYIDDNIEPIYFKDRVETTRNIEKKVVTKITESDINPFLMKQTNQTGDSPPSISTHLNTNELTYIKESKELLSNANQSTVNEAKETLIRIGDTETNNIKQNLQKLETSVNIPDSIGFSEPKSEILEPVTTVKTTTTSVKPKTNSRRGRMRYRTTTEREKELENKNVVLEKITEKAHTAKDDFNYLRTLYKVHSTTPTNSLHESRQLEDDLKEASPSDKVIRTSLEENIEDVDREISQPPDLIPIITTEATTTTTANVRVVPSIITPTLSTSTLTSSKITSITSTTEQFISSAASEKPSSTTTEEFVPSSTPLNEHIPLNTASPMITSSSTITTEKTITSTTTTTEKIIPSTTTTEKVISSTTTTEKIIPSTTTTEKVIPSTTTTEKVIPTTTSQKITSLSITTSENAPLSITQQIIPQSTTGQSTTTVQHIPSSTAGEIAAPSSTTTTERISLLTATSETTLPSSTTTETSTPSRRDSRRRGRTRFGDEPSRSRPEQKSHRRRRPNERDTTTSRSDSTTHVSSTTEESVIQKKSGYQDEIIEENGSNINRNIIPYPLITTVPNNLLFGGSTDRTEFFTQLTLNYKKIFEDISQTSEPMIPQVLDVSTVAVTETNENLSSTSAASLEQYSGAVKHEEPQEKLIHDEDLLQSATTSPKTISTVEEVVQSTLTPENVTPSIQLKTDSQVLQNEEVSTAGNVVKEIEHSNTEPIETLETAPTTSLVTEKSLNIEVISETESIKTVDDAQHKVADATTEKLSEETKPIEITTSTSSTTENIITQEKAVVTTEKTFEEVKKAEPDFMADRKDHFTPDVTTVDLKQEETHQTTLSPIRDGTALIPRITEIFNLFDITKEKDIFGIPTTLMTTEQTLKSTDSPKINVADPSSTNLPQEENISDTSTVSPSVSTTEAYKNEDIEIEYPTTIYIVRTTEKSRVEEKLHEQTTTRAEENVEEADSYPSTVYVIRTTERPREPLYEKEENVSILHQLSTQNLQKLIEEIEENTKSVVATTNVPLVETNPNAVATTEEINQDAHEDLKNVIATTERRDDLAELTSLFGYTTTRSHIATTPASTVLEPQEESSTVSSTTEASQKHQESPTTSRTSASDPELMSTSQIGKLTISENPVKTTPTTVTTTVASRRENARRGGSRATGRRNQEARRGINRHRFSTESFTKRPDGSQTVEDDIINELTKSSKGATTESYRRRLRVRPNGSRGRETSTDAALQKSASPTQPERVKESLPTTPLSKEGNGRRFFIFNCFGKQMDKFYPDPRDCRLFHYCTQGYSKNQLIDMKFVCDFNTYFDDVKLTCSKRKPKRCL